MNNETVAFGGDEDGYPSYIPREYIDEIEEPAALDVLKNLQLAQLMVPSLGLVKQPTCLSHVAVPQKMCHLLYYSMGLKAP
jgi:hypothetical protein